MQIGERIALLRKEKGLTQEQIAVKLNITAQAVSKWEKGYALPDTAILPNLAAILEVSIDRLLTGKEVTIKLSPYDSAYQKEEYYWGLEHSSLAEQIVTIIKDTQGRRLIDVGSGEGRDSIYFAKCGFTVDSLELSIAGIEKIKHYSKLENCTVNTIHANLIGFEFGESYDVIYSMGALQFLPLDQRRNHFDRYKQYTNIGGYNVHLVFVEKPFIAIAPDWGKNEFFYRSGDLAGYYHDWEIIQCGEKIIDCNSANIPHQHAVSYIIAKKN